MKILALETTDRQGNVAALDGERLLAELPLEPSQRSAQSLAPALRQLLRDVGWAPGEVEMVAVAVGPGSFTGLRVGVTTAKTFAYATGAEVQAVNSLAAIARRVPDELRLSVAMDAGRGEVYAANFQRSAANQAWLPCGEVHILPALDWMQQAVASGSPVTGPALERWASQAPAGARLLPPDLWPVTAAAIGRVAFQRYSAGHRDDLWRLAPRYYRRSAAEETWDLRQQQRAPLE